MRSVDRIRRHLEIGSIYPGFRAVHRGTKLPACFLCLCPAGWLDVTASCAMKLAYHLEGLVDDVQLVIATWNHAGVQHARFYEGAVRGHSFSEGAND